MEQNCDMFGARSIPSIIDNFPHFFFYTCIAGSYFLYDYKINDTM